METTDQPVADKAAPSDLATEISLFFENTTDYAEDVDRIIEKHARVVCSYCGDATVEQMAVVNGVWATDATDAMQAHLLACPNRPEKKLLDIMDAQAPALDALVEASGALLRAERCPNCPDQGWYADGPTDDPEQVQCEWCECVESSLFKAKARVAAALAEIERLRGGR